MDASLTPLSMLQRWRCLTASDCHQLSCILPCVLPQWCPSCIGSAKCTAHRRRNLFLAVARPAAPLMGGISPAVHLSSRPHTSSWRRSLSRRVLPYDSSHCAWGTTWPHSGCRAWSPPWCPTWMEGIHSLWRRWISIFKSTYLAGSGSDRGPLLIWTAIWSPRASFSYLLCSLRPCYRVLECWLY